MVAWTKIRTKINEREMSVIDVLWKIFQRNNLGFALKLFGSTFPLHTDVRDISKSLKIGDRD